MCTNLTQWLNTVNASDRAQHLVLFAKEHVRMQNETETLGTFLNCLNDNELTVLGFLLELPSARKDIEELVILTRENVFDENVFFIQKTSMEDTISYFKLIVFLITQSRQLGGDYLIDNEKSITFKPKGEFAGANVS